MAKIHGNRNVLLVAFKKMTRGLTALNYESLRLTWHSFRTFNLESARAVSCTHFPDIYFHPKRIQYFQVLFQKSR